MFRSHRDIQGVLTATSDNATQWRNIPKISTGSHTHMLDTNNFVVRRI
jgi:hypothetical protein